MELDKEAVNAEDYLAEDDLIKFIIDRASSGCSTTTIICELEDAYADDERKDYIAPFVDSVIREYIKDRKSKAKRSIIWGLVWGMGGLLATLVGYNIAQGGGTYLVFWGAIIWGGFKVFVGIVDLSSSHEIMALYDEGKATAEETAERLEQRKERMGKE